MRCENFDSQVDGNQKGIWRFRHFFNTEVAADYRLSLREGHTPLERLDVGSQKIWLKREDQNPHGSHKDRSLAYQVSVAKQQGQKELVISSSGNAAIAAAAYCQLAGIKLWAWLSPSIPRQKFLAMKEKGAAIILSARAIRLANYFAKKKKLVNLRPSTNDDSIVGFKTLGLELYEQWERCLPIYTYVTSGSSLIGLSQSFTELQTMGCLDKLPPLNAVQSGSIVSAGGVSADESSASLAGQGGVRRTRRAEQIQEAVGISGGQSWHVSEKEITRAAEILAQHEIKTSFEGCASLAAALSSGVGEAVCILTGRFYPADPVLAADKIGVAEAVNLADVDQIIIDD